MFNKSYRGIGRDLAITMVGAGIVRDQDEGKPAKVSGNDTLTLAGDGDPFIGVIGDIEPDLTTTLEPAGCFEHSYTGADPVVGVQKILCDAANGVKVDAVNGFPVTVLNVDTVNKIVIFYKG
jgi:hypothetical protein